MQPVQDLRAAEFVQYVEQRAGHKLIESERVFVHKFFDDADDDGGRHFDCRRIFHNFVDQCYQQFGLIHFRQRHLLGIGQHVTDDEHPDFHELGGSNKDEREFGAAGDRYARGGSFSEPIRIDRTHPAVIRKPVSGGKCPCTPTCQCPGDSTCGCTFVV